MRGILPHPLGRGASRWRRSRRSGSYQGGIGAGRAAAPAVLQFCFTDAAPAPARSTTADSARPAALRHRTEWRKKPRGPYDEWRTRAAAPLPSLVATVMHFIPVVPRRRDGADAAVLFQAFPSPDDGPWRRAPHTIRTFNYH